jgi:Popeye protein conserved region
MQTYAPYLVHVAAVFTLCCYLFRDQIRLRIFAALGDTLLIAYYYFGLAEPLWNPMVWSALNVLINSVMILIILRDQRQLTMTDSELSLFRALDTLSPGQFRKLVAKGEWHKAEEPVTLAREGENLTQLHYVLDGKVAVTKAGRLFPVEPKLFIGEVAYLRKRAATATVTVSENGTYISWPHEELEVLLRKNEDLKHALTRLLGQDLAEKMANS